jgi:hypothetical protein
MYEHRYCAVVESSVQEYTDYGKAQVIPFVKKKKEFVT